MGLIVHRHFHSINAMARTPPTFKLRWFSELHSGPDGDTIDNGLNAIAQSASGPVAAVACVAIGLGITWYWHCDSSARPLVLAVLLGTVIIMWWQHQCIVGAGT